MKLLIASFKNSWLMVVIFKGWQFPRPVEASGKREVWFLKEKLSCYLDIGHIYLLCGVWFLFSPLWRYWGRSIFTWPVSLILFILVNLAQYWYFFGAFCVFMISASAVSGSSAFIFYFFYSASYKIISFHFCLILFMFVQSCTKAAEKEFLMLYYVLKTGGLRHSHISKYII